MIWEQSHGSVTLTFSRTIKDIYITLYSVGARSNDSNWYYAAVDYAFSGLPNGIEVFSYGTSPGYDSFFLSNNGNTITGAEFSGVLKLAGNFDSLSFDIFHDEYWHGFNIGAGSLASPSTVPEPTTMLLLGLGLMGLAGIRRKFKK